LVVYFFFGRFLGWRGVWFYDSSEYSDPNFVFPFIFLYSVSFWMLSVFMIPFGPRLVGVCFCRFHLAFLGPPVRHDVERVSEIGEWWVMLGRTRSGWGLDEEETRSMGGNGAGRYM
jgi:hypothetical protein